jgi:hypothetical protein
VYIPLIRAAMGERPVDPVLEAHFARDPYYSNDPSAGRALARLLHAYHHDFSVRGLSPESLEYDSPGHISAKSQEYCLHPPGFGGGSRVEDEVYARLCASFVPR